MDHIPVVCGDYAYYPKDLIGEGQFSSVYKGFCCAIGPKKGETVAIKALIKTDQNSQMQQKIFNDQINYLSKLKNIENIISLKTVIEDQQKIYLITQFCQGGTLQNYIQKKGKLNDVEAMLFFKQLVKGYEAIYKNNIYHRDLKPENILIKNGILKICDFGFAISKTQASKEICQVGSPMYMPVEALKQNHYSHRGDMWALGITLFQMITGDLPFNAKTTQQLIKQISFIPVQRLIPKKTNPEIVSLLKKLLTIKIEQRISFLELQKLLFPLKNKEILTTMTPRNLPEKKQQLQFTPVHSTGEQFFSKNKVNVSLKPSKVLKIERKQTSDTKSHENSFHIDDKQIKRVLMAQVHLCRLCSKILNRIESINIKILSSSLKQEMTSFIFKTLKNIDCLNLLAEDVAQAFKDSEEYNKLNIVVKSYIKRYSKELEYKKQMQFDSLDQLIKMLDKEITNIWNIFQKLGGIKSNEQIGIAIDFLTTFRLLLVLLKKGNIQQFAQHSKIDKIVDGQAHATINQERVKAIQLKLKKLKLI